MKGFESLIVSFRRVQEKDGAPAGMNPNKAESSGTMHILDKVYSRRKEYSGHLDFTYFPFSDKMTMFNLHLFSSPGSEWDRIYGADGGMAYRMEEARLEAFLKAFDPEEPGKLEGVATTMMRPKALELNPDIKPLKLERLPDVVYPSNGFRAIWETSSVRKIKDFKAGLRIQLRDRIGASKTLTLKMEEAAVNGDRVVEILVSLPQSKEECAIAGQAKQAIMFSNRIQGAPKWMQHFVKCFDKNGSEAPGIYISVICNKSKDTRVFQEMLFRSFPELAGGQLEDWQMGTKAVAATDQAGASITVRRKAFFSKICIPLALHYVGTGTVALDRRAPENHWLAFEDFACKQHEPCQLCQSRDGHGTFYRMEKQNGTTEDILLCPYKGTCPQCGQGQAAFLYGGHRDECGKSNPVCEDCEKVGLPADHNPMDTLKCTSFLAKTNEEFQAKRHKQASVNKAFETLLARAISTKGKDFQPYLESRRAATKSKAHLNGFYRIHEELGDFQDTLRAMAPGRCLITYCRSGNRGLTMNECRKKSIRRVRVGPRALFTGFAWTPLDENVIFRAPDAIDGGSAEDTARRSRKTRRPGKPWGTGTHFVSASGQVPFIFNFNNKDTCSDSSCIYSYREREQSLSGPRKGLGSCSFI